MRKLDCIIIKSEHSDNVRIHVTAYVVSVANMSDAREYDVTAYDCNDAEFYSKTFATIYDAFCDLHRFNCCDYAESVYTTDDESAAQMIAAS